MKEGAFGAYINAAYRQHPLWWLAPPKGVLGNVPHVSTGKHREAYSAP